MHLKKIHHVAIIVSDYERSKFFYMEILGFKMVSEVYRKERDSYKLNLSLPLGDMLEIFSFPNSPDRLSYPEAIGLRHLAFETDDIRDAIATLEKKGVSVEPVRIDEETGKQFTFFSDPDGLPIELYEG